MNIFEQLDQLIDTEALKDKTSLLIDELPIEKHTYLDPKKDPRFIFIQRDSSGYGEIIMKPLPFPDRVDNRDFMLTIDFMKHSKIVNNTHIHENCPKTIGLECAICDHLSDIPRQMKHIIQGIVINNSGNTKYIGEIKLFEMTRRLLSLVASNDTEFMDLFDYSKPTFLKIVIRKSDDGYFTYDESHVFEDNNIDIKSIIKPDEEFFYKDLKDVLYDKNNFMSYERMMRKYVKHLQHYKSDKEEYHTPREDVEYSDPIVTEEEMDSFMEDIVDDIIVKESVVEEPQEEVVNDIVNELLVTEEKAKEETKKQEEPKKEDKKKNEEFDIEAAIEDENFFDSL